MKERGFAILATMFAVTSLDLDDEGKRELARKVHADLGKIITYTNGPSLTFSMVERERRRGKTMDQTVFFCFYLWESGDRIVFSTYFISDVEKGTER